MWARATAIACSSCAAASTANGDVAFLPVHDASASTASQIAAQERTRTGMLDESAAHDLLCDHVAASNACVGRRDVEAARVVIAALQEHLDRFSREQHTLAEIVAAEAPPPSIFADETLHEQALDFLRRVMDDAGPFALSLRLLPKSLLSLGIPKDRLDELALDEAHLLGRLRGSMTSASEMTNLMRRLAVDVETNSTNL